MLKAYSTSGVYQCDVNNGCSDPITCSGYATDGLLNSSIETANVTIANTIPEAQNVYIQPPSPSTNDNLICNYTYYDADGDSEVAVYYTWYVE